MHERIYWETTNHLVEILGYEHLAALLGWKLADAPHLGLLEPLDLGICFLDQIEYRADEHVAERTIL